jgi:hypothetical protein
MSTGNRWQKKNKMKYIWNRADRVRKDLMPQRIIDCFNEWEKVQKEKLSLMPDPDHNSFPEKVARDLKAKRYRIKYSIHTQARKLKEALRKFENENN